MIMKKELTKVWGLREIEVTCRSTSSELDGSMLEQPPTSTLAPHSPHCSPQNPFSLSPARGGQFQKTTKYKSPPLPHPLLLSSCLEVVPCGGRVHRSRTSSFCTLPAHCSLNWSLSFQLGQHGLRSKVKHLENDTQAQINQSWPQWSKQLKS